jgi:hypothetical protein
MRASLLVSQSRDDIAQGRKTLINFLRFFESLTCGLRDANPLRPGQIDQIELADLDLLGRILCIISRLFALRYQDSHLLDDDDEDGVRARGKIIHFSSGRGSALGSLLHEGVHLVRGTDSPLGKAFDEDTLFAVFTDLERRAFDLQ